MAQGAAGWSEFGGSCLGPRAGGSTMAGSRSLCVLPSATPLAWLRENSEGTEHRHEGPRRDSTEWCKGLMAGKQKITFFSQIFNVSHIAMLVSHFLSQSFWF